MIIDLYIFIIIDINYLTKVFHQIFSLPCIYVCIDIKMGDIKEERQEKLE